MELIDASILRCQPRVDMFRPQIDDAAIVAGRRKEQSEELSTLESVIWPPLVARALSLVKQPTKLRDVLKAAAQFVATRQA